MPTCFTDLAQQYIDGEWRPGTGSWDLIDFDPYNGEKLAAITIATADEVDQAYRAAARAQQPWAAGSPYARRAVLEKALSPEQAWDAVTVDDRWQLEQWGSDAEAEAALENRRGDFFAAARFLELLDG